MESVSRIEEVFCKNLDTVIELLNFDRIILDTCTHHIESLNEKLKAAPFEIGNKLYLADHTLKTIKNVRTNDSLRPKYKHIFNSCLVLQVSYFTSALEEMFHVKINNIEMENIPPELKKHRPNFQNLFSAKKTFKNYLLIDIESLISKALFNDILVAVNSRHNIVHALGVIDEKFIKQTQNATPRKLKEKCKIDQKLEFSAEEIIQVKETFEKFIKLLRIKLETIS